MFLSPENVAIAPHQQTHPYSKWRKLQAQTGKNAEIKGYKEHTSIVDTSTSQLLYLWIGEHCGRGDWKVVRDRISENYGETIFLKKWLHKQDLSKGNDSTRAYAKGGKYHSITHFRPRTTGHKWQ